MRGIALLVAILAVLATANAAHAHASLIRSDPADRTVVAQPPQQLTLTFNEPVSPLALRLVRPNGEVVDLKNVTASGATIAAAPPTDLLRGTHLLSWRVISADGHPVGGALTFSVGLPSDTPAMLLVDADIRLRGAIWLARFVLYLGLFIGVGGAFYTCWISTSPPSGWTKTATTVALQCGLVAALVSVGLQGLDVLGVPLPNIRDLRVWGSGFATAYGLTLCIAVVALALGLTAMSVRRPIARWCSALGLAGVGVAFAASGHAATAGPELVTRPTVLLHGMSVAFWVGALLPLAAALHAGDGRSELVRFSKAIPLPLVTLLLSGLLLAVVQMWRLDALWTTNYGLILCGKLVAVGALLVLAATNRRLTPRVTAGDARSARRLGKSIQVELVIIAVILGLVASWRFTPPPRSLLAAAAQPVHAHIHREKAMADLQIGPAGADGRQITIGLLDGEFRPLLAKEVLLVLSKPESGIEPLRVAATPIDTTIWRIDGVRLPISGRWHARVEILVNDFEKIALEDEIDLR
jgi:copper transport protein